MHASQVLRSAAERLRRPAAWGGVLLFGGLWSGLRLVAGPTALPTGELLFPFALALGVLALSAVPWQWTGTSAPLAPLWRGALQAVPWTLAWLLPLSHLLEHGGRGGRNAADLPLVPPLPPRMMILVVAAGAFAWLAGWLLADRDHEAQRAQEQARLAREAQRLALQSRMSPHVLHNTLSGLAELAREDGLAAERALVELSTLLRRLLDHAGRDRAPLREERALVEGLLALERFRLGPRLEISWSWDEALEQECLPPLLLQPLVENALKHGIAPCRTGGRLEIGLGPLPKGLRLWVANTGLPLDAQGREGLGLGHLRQRLDLLEGWRGTFDLRQDGDRTVADIRLEASHG